MPVMIAFLAHPEDSPPSAAAGATFTFFVSGSAILTLCLDKIRYRGAMVKREDTEEHRSKEMIHQRSIIGQKRELTYVLYVPSVVLRPDKNRNRGAKPKRAFKYSSCA